MVPGFWAGQKFKGLFRTAMRGKRSSKNSNGGIPRCRQLVTNEGDLDSQTLSQIPLALFKSAKEMSWLSLTKGQRVVSVALQAKKGCQPKSKKKETSACNVAVEKQ